MADLKVLHFTTTIGTGGAETMLCNTVEALTRRGIANVVVSTTSSSNEHSLRPRIEQSAPFYDLETCSLFSPRTISGFAEILHREKPDVIQTWMHRAGGMIGLVSRLHGYRNVVWAIHSKDLLCTHPAPCFPCLSTGLFLGLLSHFVPRRIISCSQAGAETHRDLYGYDASRMEWIGNGIDIQRFQPSPEKRRAWRASQNIPADAPVIGIAARAHPVKDLPTFFHAAALLQQIRPEAHFAFAGTPRTEVPPEVSEAASRLPDPSRIHWLGYTGNLEAIYPGFDILTLSSLSEAYPMVLIEGMACGCPCVSTDVGDAALILGDAGEIVPPANPSAMAAAWNRILDLPASGTALLGQRARHRAETCFSLETAVSRYEAFYRVLANRPAHRNASTSFDPSAPSSPVLTAAASPSCF